VRGFLLPALMVLLASCSGPPLPFEKEAPSGNLSIRPPWEALVQAGPGAENDLDFETLDGPMVSSPPQQPAQGAQAADLPEPPSMPQKEERARPPQDVQPTDKPKKKGIAIKAVAVPSVTGAKGRGNSELTEAMRKILKQAGWPVLAGRREDALLITGRVALATPSGAMQRVRLVWTVAAPDGKVLGEIVQENDVPAGSLDQGWGENAGFASEAAAEGIFKLIQGLR
jgi:hypothetical protein